MLIKVVEMCEVTPYEDGIKKGKRTFIYESDKESLEEAIIDITESFDSDNIVWSNDEFDGECNSSEALSYEITEERY